VGSCAVGLASFAVTFALAVASGCGSSSGGGVTVNGDAGAGSSSGGGDGGASSSGGDDAASSSSSGGSSGAGSSTYPAFPPEMGTIVDAKGGTLTAAKIVTVTWSTDPNAATLQDFDDKLGASQYWRTALAEYGIGPATGGASDHVVVTTAPPNPWDASAIDAWTQQMAAAAPGNGWPAPDAQTVYMVFVPPDVVVNDKDPGTGQPTDACNLEQGYHVAITAGSNPDGVAYALCIQHCSSEYGTQVVSDSTETAAHEIAGAATDPYPTSAPAWGTFDADHLGWELWNDYQDEVADACEWFDEVYYEEGADLPYMVARLWSNASGKAGHDPCVPAPAGAYNNVTPLGLESVSVTAIDVNGGVSPFTTKGWHVPVGQTVKVTVGFYSDAPHAAWQVQADEGDCCTQPWDSVLTVSPSSFAGQNGDTVELSITTNQAPAQGDAALLTFSSDAGQGTKHHMPVVVATK
jgi:hypothetical protein